MSEVADAAYERGGVQIVLNGDEVGLLAAAVTWMRADLQFTEQLAERHAPQEVKEQIPADFFDSWKTLLEGLHQTLVVHALTDAQEREGDDKRKAMESDVARWIKQGLDTQRFTSTLRSAAMSTGESQPGED